MMSLSELKEQYSNNKINYSHLFDKMVQVGNYEGLAYLDVIVPNYQRANFCNKTLQYLDRSLRASEVSYNLICMNFEESEDVRKVCEEIGAIYLCCPSFPESHQGEFSRALSFDLPCKYLKVNSPWVIFTDSDLLVTESFIKNTVSRLKYTHSWLQPYTNKRVTNLTAKSTISVLNSKDSIDLEVLECTYPKPGAPGGCIVVPTALYNEVGGYDPEIFWGYGPEDSMFWVKLESCFSKIDAIGECHQGNATYSDSETVYHLNHPSRQGLTPNYLRMLTIHNSFLNLPHEDKVELIKFKKGLYGN